MAKRVQVVLTENISSLGKDGDVVEVAPGYARNFLFPTGKAVNVTPSVLKQIERKREKEKIAAEEIKKEALNFKTALKTIGRFTIKKQVGEDGVLFGTVTNGDVAEAIKVSTKKEIDRRDIQVPDIHTLGSYTVQIKLHQEVSAEVNIEVTSEIVITSNFILTITQVNRGPSLKSGISDIELYFLEDVLNEQRLYVKDYFEDLDVSDVEKIIDKIMKGEKPNPGSYKGRKNSEPVNNRKTLIDIKNA